MKFFLKPIFFLLFMPQFINAQINKAEVLVKIEPPHPDPSGIAVSSDNRVFLGFPRHADNHKNFALAELKDGRLIPFLDKAFTYPSQKPVGEWLVSPHGIYMDKNDVLWILDDGKRAGIKEIPYGAAKVVAVDIRQKKIIHSIPVSKDAYSNSSHLNDLRVDLSHGAKGTVYIANSGFGKHYSLVVMDVASGRSREVLLNHFSTSPEPGFMAFLEGQPRVLQGDSVSFPNGGADGITISPDEKTLYWTAISGRKLYSIPTEILSDFSKSEKEIEEAVKFEGEHPACDGLAEDEQGNIYFGAFEQQSIVKRTPEGIYRLVSHDAKNYVWPDGMAYKNGFVYVTLGQWNRLADFNNGRDLRKPPYLVVRIKVK